MGLDISICQLETDIFKLLYRPPTVPPKLHENKCFFSKNWLRWSIQLIFKKSPVEPQSEPNGAPFPRHLNTESYL